MSKKSLLQTLNSKDGTDFARALRVQSTDAERLVWTKLRARQIEGLKFRRQVPMGRYIVDFLCEDKKLIVELDGGQYGEATEYDEARTRWLNEKGYFVVRFWNNDVMNNIDGVLQSLTLTLCFASSVPLSQGRGNLEQRRFIVPSPLGEG
ncbi:MAG: endonuclease domain-containing protein [Betaproteobacteria bacterium]